jgi:hypothetical protein
MHRRDAGRADRLEEAPQHVRARRDHELETRPPARPRRGALDHGIDDGRIDVAGPREVDDDVLDARAPGGVCEGLGDLRPRVVCEPAAEGDDCQLRRVALEPDCAVPCH